MKILVAGDFAPRRRISQLIGKEDYSFFSDVKQITSAVDYSIVNFESPVVESEAKPIVKTGPNLSCDKNAMKAVKYAGFHCVTLANNHFYDFGDSGVKNTLDACVMNEMDYVGGGLNIIDAQKILYKDICGKRLAIVNFCENEWSIATEDSGGSAPLDIVSNCRAIKEAKSNADIVLVIVHGGTEKYQLPTPRMKKTYRFFIENGADAVVNHHQHCFSGYEVYNGKPIFYGLGNFCFDINKPDNELWNTGYVVVLDVNDKNNIEFEIIPYEQCGCEPKISFLKDKGYFVKKIVQLNEIIADDNQLQKSFEEMALSKKSLFSCLEPFNGKYVSLLRSRHLFPSFMDKKKKMLYLELFRCEAHKDIMFNLLKR